MTHKFVSLMQYDSYVTQTVITYIYHTENYPGYLQLAVYQSVSHAHSVANAAIMCMWPGAHWSRESLLSWGRGVGKGSETPFLLSANNLSKWSR